MTDERLAVLERLAAAASPGPASVHECREDAREPYWWVSFGAPSLPSGGWATDSTMMDRANADYLAAAWEAVPELAAEVRRLRAELAAERERRMKAEGDALWAEVQGVKLIREGRQP